MDWSKDTCLVFMKISMLPSWCTFGNQFWLVTSWVVTLWWVVFWWWILLYMSFRDFHNGFQISTITITITRTITRTATTATTTKTAAWHRLTGWILLDSGLAPQLISAIAQRLTQRRPGEYKVQTASSPKTVLWKARFNQERSGLHDIQISFSLSLSLYKYTHIS